MSTELRLELIDPGVDDEELEELAASLRLELLELDVESVSPVVLGSAPEGSKGLELAALGALLVRVHDSLPVVRTVVTTVRDWLVRAGSAGRSLTITVEGRTLELSAATAEQQQLLVEEFVRSLSAPGDAGTAPG